MTTPKPPRNESLLYTHCHKWAKRLWPNRLRSSDAPKPTSKIAPHVTHFMAPYQMVTVRALILLTIAALTVLSFGFALRLVVDHGFSHEKGTLLNTGFLFFLGASALLAVNAYFRITTTSWLGERVVSDVRRTLFEHLLKLDQTFFENARIGDLIARINTDTSQLLTLFTNSAASAVRSLLQLVGGSMMMCLTSLKLTGIVFLVVPVILSPIWILGRLVKRLTRCVQESQGDGEAFAAEHLGSVSILQTFGQEKSAFTAFNTLLMDRLELVKKRIHVRSALVCVVIFFAFASVSCVLWIGSQDVLSGEMSAGALTSFVFFAVIVAGSLNSLSEVFGEIQMASGACERLVDILEARSCLIEPPHNAPVATFERSLRLENITFSYPTRPTLPALEHFSLTIKKGERLALVGPSGAGKSTLFQLLLRLFDPQEGAVIFDDQPATSLDLASIRSLFAVVPQEPVIFNATIEENVRFGPRAHEGDGALMQACRHAHVDTFAKDLPEGYATKVGERGVKLSGGQKQRIALARAFLRQGEILLLDEATNALDSENEHHIQEALDLLLKDKTAIIIAHRLSTIQKVDRILVLDQGRLVEEGTHDTLMARGGLYARLAAKQFGPL